MKPTDAITLQIPGGPADPLIDFLTEQVMAQSPQLPKRQVREVASIIVDNNVVSHTHTVRRLAADLADAFIKSSQKSKRPATLADVTLAFNEALSSILFSFAMSVNKPTRKSKPKESEEKAELEPVKDGGPELYR